MDKNVQFVLNSIVETKALNQEFREILKKEKKILEEIDDVNTEIKKNLRAI